jgi:hypothetical protein
VHKRNAEWYGAFKVYIPVLLAGSLPWSVLAVRAAGGLRPAWSAVRTALRERQPQALLLAYWLGVPLLVFFLARSRLHLYVLPLFVPLAIVMARTLATWPWLTARRLGVTLVVTLAAMVSLKGVVAYQSSDRDARALARHFTEFLDPHDISEIVFVGMRPFYGLNVYLDRHIQGVDIGQRRFEYSRVVTEQTLCDELAAHRRAAYATKQHHAARFITPAERCGWQATPVGSVYADGTQVEFFLLRPRAE